MYTTHVINADTRKHRPARICRELSRQYTAHAHEHDRIREKLHDPGIHGSQSKIFPLFGTLVYVLGGQQTSIGGYMLGSLTATSAFQTNSPFLTYTGALQRAKFPLDLQPAIAYMGSLSERDCDCLS
jgi:hypothetical protein